MKQGKLTTVVHAGEHYDERTGAIMTPIFQTSTFVQQEPGVHKGWDYSRAGNPTRDALEEAYAAIEGAKYGLAFASGLAAEQAIIQLLNPGDKVLVCDDVYGGTGRLFRKLYAKYNIDFQFIDLTIDAQIEKELTPNVKMIWVETPTNPLLKIIDIKKMRKWADKAGAMLIVDNTFASPIFQNPIALGADVVMHSTTKYIGGHSDIIGGAVMTSRDDLYEQIKFIQFAAGATPGPFESFLLLRSLKTLGIRMIQHDKNAREVAKFLKTHKKVEKVFYPGFEDHESFAVAKSQMTGFSGMVSFRLKGDYAETVKFLGKLKLFALAESLGGVESLVNHPEKMTHASVPPDLRQKLGIGPNLIRLSVGIEDVQDLIADLSNAFG
jgi:cystathionine beta-lyase/cystathionine gamma-synthase